jgi:hypothetical protein
MTMEGVGRMAVIADPQGAVAKKIATPRFVFFRTVVIAQAADKFSSGWSKAGALQLAPSNE